MMTNVVYLYKYINELVINSEIPSLLFQVLINRWLNCLVDFMALLNQLFDAYAVYRVAKLQN